MTTSDLVQRYEDLHGHKCRTRHRAYLIRKIAWRIQANAEGGLSERARKRATELADLAEVRVMAPTGFTDNCPHCGCRTVSLVRCEECGDAAVAGIQTDDFRLRAATPDELAAARDTTDGHTTGVLMFSLQAVPPGVQTHWHVNLDTGELGGSV